MSETNKPEDPIEELFQKKAEEYDIPFREKDWERLEKRLSAADRKKAGIMRRRWLVAASVLLFSLLAYFTYDNYSSINRINDQLSSESTPEMQREATRENSQPQSEQENTGSKEDADPDQMAGETNTGQINSNLASNDESNNNSTQESGTSSSGQLMTGNTLRDLYISEISCQTCTLSNLAARDERPGSFNLLQSKQEGESAIASADQERAKPLEVDRSGSRLNSSRFALGMVLSPDLSTVGSISNFSDVGYKAGITFEYRINPRLSVTGGLIQSDVRYKASGNDYNPPAGYWSDGIIPYETAGRCILIDIPINLKFEFMQFSRSRMYASAGLSSYIMLSEDYKFKYSSYGSGQADQWSSNTGTRHWMSNAGFSIGYELDIHQNWSLRAEPFIRVPLKEVGWGKVNLYSMGSFISINYRL